MTEREDEDSTESSSGRPNSYWADVRAKQANEAVRETGYGGDFRGIPTPKAGPQSVRPEHTIGGYDTCWCGQPADHDWPGKDKGRKHPKEQKVSAVAAETEAPHIEKSMLRAYNDDIAAVIIMAVNDYGVRYRMTKAGVLLYPPDGAQPTTLGQRNHGRQDVLAARKWFVNHVLGVDPKNINTGSTQFVKDVGLIREDMDMREAARLLAASKNGPEHPLPPPETSDQKRARKAQERREEAARLQEQADTRRAAAEAAEPAAAPPVKAVPGDPRSQRNSTPLIEETRRRSEAASAAHARKKEQPVASALEEEIAHEQEPEFHVSETEGWVTWRNSIGEERPMFETDGEKIRCRVCKEVLPSGRSTSGHSLNHDTEYQDRLWGKDSQAKKAQTREKKVLVKGMEQAVAALQAAMGVDPELTAHAKVTRLEQELERVTKRLDKAVAERDAAIAKRDEAQARLDLMKEALGA